MHTCCTQGNIMIKLCQNEDIMSSQNDTKSQMGLEVFFCSKQYSFTGTISCEIKDHKWNY